ncbi:MAG: hypothetical protein HYT07_01210 [Candidatus Levybacteria bacterium]|nr:hypothetical protein [Candidatus Levybacteria bacterium]
MKEQERQIDPLKEPVAEETIGAIVEECHRIFLDPTPPTIVKESIFDDREGITRDGKTVAIIHNYFRIDSEDEKNGEMAERYGLKDTSFSDSYNPINRYGIHVTEIFSQDSTKPKKIISIDKYFLAEDLIDNGIINDKYQVISYLYAIDSDANFLQLYICHPALLFWFPKELPLAENEAKDLLTRGVPMARVSFETGWPNFGVSLSDAIRPSEEHAQTLLQSLKGLQQVIRINLDKPDF